MHAHSANNAGMAGLLAVASVSFNVPAVAALMPVPMKLALSFTDTDAFFARANAEYANLAGDAEAWAEELSTRLAWDQTLGDGSSSRDQGKGPGKAAR